MYCASYRAAGTDQCPFESNIVKQVTELVPRQVMVAHIFWRLFKGLEHTHDFVCSYKKREKERERERERERGGGESNIELCFDTIFDSPIWGLYCCKQHKKSVKDTPFSSFNVTNACFKAFLLLPAISQLQAAGSMNSTDTYRLCKNSFLYFPSSACLNLANTTANSYIHIIIL